MKTGTFFDRLVSGRRNASDAPYLRLHPSVRLAVPFLLSAGILITSSIPLLAGAFCVVVSVARLSGMSFRKLAGAVKASIPALVMIALIRLLFIPGGGETVLSTPLFTLSSGTLLAACVSVLRLLDLVLLFSAVGTSIDAEEIVTGVRGLLGPFSRSGAISSGAALALTVLFRFVPLLSRETERLVKAQSARGADFAERSRNPVRRVAAFLPLLVPLFLSALRRAETLVLAMEARGYSGTGRVKRNGVRLNAVDIGTLVAGGLWCLAAVLVR